MKYGCRWYKSSSQSARCITCLPLYVSMSLGAEQSNQTRYNPIDLAFSLPYRSSVSAPGFFTGVARLIVAPFEL